MKRIVLVGGLLCTHTAHAQVSTAHYPSKPIRVIVPFPAGGGADLIARVVSQKLTEAWSQQVVVDNRAGAGTIIGAEIAARATPDGYTLYFANPAHAINPGLRKLPFDAQRDFAAISIIATQPGLLVVHPSLAARNVKELMALARAKPKDLRYASAGIGSIAHLSAELFANMTSLQFTHVPYKGTAGYLPDLLGARVDFMFAPMANVLQQTQAGKLRALAVTSPQRTAAAPDVPTVIEEGVPGFQAMSWYLLLAPALTPRAIIEKLNAETTRILKSSDVQKRFAREGAEAAGSTSREAAQFLASEIALWARVIKAANVKAE